MHLFHVVHGLAARPEVIGAAIISGDGLVIHQVLPAGADPDALAALATTLLRHTAELGAAARLGPLTTAVLDFGPGPVIVSALGEGAALVLLVRADADFGELLYLVRRHQPAIAGLL
ncbi:MAG TPA: roadblock/LC7 domain-containing protein [Gemmatimonadales bacterium]